MLFFISFFCQKVNTYTDITYQATAGGGGGMIKARDFVNLRCWRLFIDGKMRDDTAETETSDDEEMLNNSCEGSVSTISDQDDLNGYGQPSSVGSCRNGTNMTLHKENMAFQTLSKSLGAKDFSEAMRLNFNEPPPLDDEFEDAKDNIDETNDEQTNTKPSHSPLKDFNTKGKVWLSAAISVEYDKVPAHTKYTRGENLVAGFAMHEIEGKPDACIFEWIICLDLKGYIPRYVLDTVRFVL